MFLRSWVTFAWLTVCGLSLNIGGRGMSITSFNNDGLQDIISWDEHSLFVRGERILFYSGEFHPFRLPVPSLWPDIFQKIKALGYTGVSFYINWSLLEGEEGVFTAEGIFDLDPFFAAASSAGIYLLARPGPYINAEVSGGGFPGWLQRTTALPRTREAVYLNSTTNYVSNVARIISKHQITQGGPVILLQPENEYTAAIPSYKLFPDPVYFGHVEDQYRENGIVVPLISNDAYPAGNFVPGTPAAVDIYGHDGYPLGFDCSNPSVWPDNYLPTDYGTLHLEQSPSTPYSIVEFQGGSFDQWGGPGYAKCAELLGSEFERVFYKNDISFGVKIFNLYMTYGGTNWGNMAVPGLYTSYDYGAAIAEDRTVTREKYGDAKLIATFLQSSPVYLTAVYQNNSYTTGMYTSNSDIGTTLLSANSTKFYVLRQNIYNSQALQSYTFEFSTSKGNIMVPQLGANLTLNGRDSKIYISDYDLDGTNLLYSTAELFCWKVYGTMRVLVLYGELGEVNEFAIAGDAKLQLVEGPAVKSKRNQHGTVVQYTVTATRSVVQVGNTYIYLLNRNSAFEYWAVNLPNDSISGNYTNSTLAQSLPLVRLPYLLRTIETNGKSMHMTGDVNATSPLEIISGAPQPLHELTFNGKNLQFKQAPNGVVTATVDYIKPEFSVPDLSTIEWKVLDTLPEIESNYDDSLWTSANWTQKDVSWIHLKTPTSLFAGDYGYHYGYMLYRGHFTATGSEKMFNVTTQGADAYGHSVWLNGTFIGSWAGAVNIGNHKGNYSLPELKKGEPYVLTILIDTMSLDENYDIGTIGITHIRGILDFDLVGRNATDIDWKLTGNLHGEQYVDKTRGPLNEGGLYAERQGYHLPGSPIASWPSKTSGPMAGFAGAGVHFYATDFSLDLPAGYDIPLYLTFGNGTTAHAASSPYRCQIWVNGYHFAKYISFIGPQSSFPVPEGIWNYHGTNYVAVSLWALESSGAKVSSLEIVAGTPIQSGYGTVELSPLTGWKKRVGAY